MCEINNELLSRGASAWTEALVVLYCGAVTMLNHSGPDEKSVDGWNVPTRLYLVKHH